jgi:hypothetical protein
VPDTAPEKAPVVPEIPVPAIVPADIIEEAFITPTTVKGSFIVIKEVLVDLIVLLLISIVPNVCKTPPAVIFPDVAVKLPGIVTLLVNANVKVSVALTTAVI